MLRNLAFIVKTVSQSKLAIYQKYRKKYNLQQHWIPTMPLLWLLIRWNVYSPIAKNKECNASFMWPLPSPLWSSLFLFQERLAHKNIAVPLLPWDSYNRYTLDHPETGHTSSMAFSLPGRSLVLSKMLMETYSPLQKVLDSWLSPIYTRTIWSTPKRSSPSLESQEALLLAIQFQHHYWMNKT